MAADALRQDSGRNRNPSFPRTAAFPANEFHPLRLSARRFSWRFPGRRDGREVPRRPFSRAIPFENAARHASREWARQENAGGADGERLIESLDEDVDIPIRTTGSIDPFRYTSQRSSK
jgi:hypothetical protein